LALSMRFLQMTECAEIRSGEKGVRLFIEYMKVRIMFGICVSKASLRISS